MVHRNLSFLDEEDTPTPSQLLAMSIRKRRSVMNRKNRDVRKELLLGATIKTLCKLIGEERASRKRRSPVRDDECDFSITKKDSSKRVCRSKDINNGSIVSGTVEGGRVPFGQSMTYQYPALSVSGNSGPAEGPCTIAADPVAMDTTSTSDNFSCVSRRHSSVDSSSTTSYNENDPFGLDSFFASLRTCRSSA